MQALLRSLRQHGVAVDRLEYYLERHMHLDADEHGPMAAALLESLCGPCEARAAQAAAAAERCLQLRIALWDGIVAAIQEQEAPEGSLSNQYCLV